MSSDTKTIRVLAADDHALLRQRIASVLGSRPIAHLRCTLPIIGHNVVLGIGEGRSSKSYK